MLRGLYVSFAALVAAVFIAQPVAAQTVYDGVTTEELRTALEARFSVKAETIDGRTILWVQGKNHTIAASPVHCGGNARCEGVKYLALMPTAASLTFINKFNREKNYTKVMLGDDGTVAMTVDLLTVGGVTADNLAYNAAALMYRMTEYSQANVQVSLPPSPTAPSASMLTAFAAESWGTGTVASSRQFRIDPALAKAMTEQLKLSD
jgi:hypothetical protein